METLLTSRNRASPGRRLQKNSSTSRLKIPGGEVAAEKKGTCMPLLTRTVIEEWPESNFYELRSQIRLLCFREL